MAALEEAGEKEDDAMDEDEEAVLDDMPLALQELQSVWGVPARPRPL